VGAGYRPHGRTGILPDRCFECERETTVAKSDKRPGITLACEQCKRRNYQTTKNKVNTRDRLQLKKYCAWCGSHTDHRETR